MNLAYGLLETSSAWVPVRSGESGDFVYRRHDDLAYAKVASRSRVADLASERDRLAWLHGIRFGRLGTEMGTRAVASPHQARQP